MKPIAVTVFLLFTFGLLCASAALTGTVTDIDGNVYQTVIIGTQEWMAENLKAVHYRNGDTIPNVTDGATWAGLTTGAYCEYNNDGNNVATYGRLYNWYAIADSRNIAPAGWHVPTDAEWQTLVDFLGGDAIAGVKMKEAGYAHWVDPNTGATNESGFSALPGGYRDGSPGFYYGMGYNDAFWSFTEYDSYGAWSRGLDYYNSAIFRFSSNKEGGLSVRCVRDIGCCVISTGNVNMSGIVDMADLSDLVSYLTGGGYALPCPNAANVNATGIVDLGDLSALVSYLTLGGYILPDCL